MAKNIKINGATYENVPEMNAPLADGSGVAHFYDTDGDTAVAENILAGKSAHAKGGAVSGTMVDNGAVEMTISTLDTPAKIAKGYHDGSGTVSLDPAETAKITSDNIKGGVTVFGVAGSTTVMETKEATATAATIKKGSTACVKGEMVTGTMTAATVSQDSSTKVVSVS